MTPPILHLELVRAEVHGVLQTAATTWRTQQALAHLRQGAHAAAVRVLMALARSATEWALTTQAWRELVTQILELGVRGSLRSELGEAFDAYAQMAWSGARADAMPWELERVFAVGDEVGTWTSACYLGDLVARTYPTCPLGHYAAAHFRELACIASEDRRATKMHAIAQRFAQAKALAEQLGRAKHAAHYELRRGVCLLLGGVDKQSGRDALRQCAMDELTQTERVWYALGMAHSDFWLDRVRAADAIDELAAEIARGAGRAAGTTLEELRGVTHLLLEREGVEFHAAEEDRLSALIDTLFEGDEREAMRRALGVRIEIMDVGRGLLTKDERVASALREQAQTCGGAWAPISSGYDLLRSLLEPGLLPEDVPDIPREPPSEDMRAMHQAIEILHALALRDDAALELALQRTQRALKERAQDTRPATLRPLSVAFPRLLEHVRRTPKDDDAERLAFAMERTQEILLDWSQAAPAPSYGWWGLAAHAVQARLHRAADAVAMRAVRGYGECDPKLRDYVVGKMLAWSVEEADKVTMLRWLEVAESYDEA